MSITPGKLISLEIIAPPRSAAGRKTLTRLCRKDPGIAAHHRNQSRTRPSHQQWRRGGNYWNHRMKSRPSFDLVKGGKFKLLATVDVVRDLESIKTYVKVTPA